MAINAKGFLNAIKKGVGNITGTTQTDAYTKDTLKRGDELISAIRTQRPRQQARNAVKAKMQQAEYAKKYKGADFIKPIK